LTLSMIAAAFEGSSGSAIFGGRFG